LDFPDVDAKLRKTELLATDVGEYEIQKVLEIVCETRWRWSRMARYRNRKGNDVVRIGNM